MPEKKGGLGRSAFFKQERRAPEDASNTVASDTPASKQATDTQATDTQEAKYWHKQTVPFRSAQWERLDDLLDGWKRSLKVRVTAAEVLRLALDEILAEMERDPDAVILRLYQQERREQADEPKRKFGRSKGAADYLRRKGKL